MGYRFVSGLLLEGYCISSKERYACT